MKEDSKAYRNPGSPDNPFARFSLPQVIFQGPPGTGKTYEAKRIAHNVTGEKESGNKWEIIQFHPSYNYEDFVRGIQIKTENGNTSYETVDRILVQMAEKAAKDSGKKYVLIIDEINRANIAAVLGELIYALEYRGEPVYTTYEIKGKRAGIDSHKITLPKNLYIIGTMNTADRTIGQIDYAVRRRFAFDTFLPKPNIVEQESKADKAVELFDKVAKLFDKNNECLSPDYHADDVAIGHSYFLANSNEELKSKIKYQVIPILKEYVKDGVLLEKANEKIEELREALQNQSTQYQENNNQHDTSSKSGSSRKKFKWENNQDNIENIIVGVGRLVLDIVRDYAKNNKPENIKELKKDFPDRLKVGFGVVQLRDDENYTKFLRETGYPTNRYFIREDELISFPDGKRAMVSTQWGATGTLQTNWIKFMEHCHKLDYKIEEIS